MGRAEMLLIAAVGVVLTGVHANGQSSAPSAEMPGVKVYEETCSRCHGRDGRSTTAPILVPFQWSYSQALDIVRHGGPCGMPAFTESQLSDDEVKQIVDYLKTLN
jgi:mono/diheme cytochrome c family protein